MRYCPMMYRPPHLRSAAGRLCHLNMRFQRMGTVHSCVAPSPSFGGKSTVPFRYAFSTHGHSLYQSRSSADTLFSFISLCRTAPSRSLITRSAIFLMASLCVTIIMVLPYFLFTSSISLRISFEVL